MLWRKSSFGIDSAKGSRFVERLLTVVATGRQQGRNVLDYLAACHRADLNRQPFLSLLRYAGEAVNGYSGGCKQTSATARLDTSLLASFGWRRSAARRPHAKVVEMD